MTFKVAYTKLGEQIAPIREQLLDAAAQVLDSGHYILGPSVERFEQEFAELCTTRRAVGVSNGTCSLTLLLRAAGIGPGDEVITAPNSFIASASAIVKAGAVPVFADIRRDLNIDPDAVSAAITSRTKALLPVHLTGRPAAMEKLEALAKRHSLFLLEDAAQAVAARYKDRPVGSFGNAGSFSLHPLKNLFAFGDAGIITTNDGELAEEIIQARNHGFRNRNECDYWSCNCRLDELQAAFLCVQLKHLESYTKERRRLAFRYNEALAGLVEVPREAAEEYCVYQTYIIQADRRDDLQQFLNKREIDTKIHYPIPIHLQKAAQSLGYRPEDFPVTIEASHKILSLPLYPGLLEAQQNYVIESIRSFYEG